ncbi:MAG: carboxypeptidase-like regulatory domain-containing protein [bacterium]
MLKRNIVALVAMAALVATGCGGDNAIDENLSVNDVAPTGSVGGQVLNATDDRPLAGASVRIIAGDFTTTTTTDGSGIFSISEVPASGPVLIIITASSFLSAEVIGTFNNAAGNFPVNNATLTVGPIGLEPSNGFFSLYVFDENGMPAVGHEISLTTNTRFLMYDNGQPVDQGEHTVSGLVGTNGLITFTGIPDYWALGGKVDADVTITVPPFDSNADGYYEYPGGFFFYNVLDLPNPQPTIVLQTDGTYPNSLAILASNVQALEGWSTSSFVPDTVNGVGPIHVLFNLPVDETSLSVEVWNEDGTTYHTPNLSLDGRSLTIQFPTALPAVPTGAEYNILISAVANTGDRLVFGSFNAAFFVIDQSLSADDVTATAAKEDPTNPADPWVVVTFSEPVGFGIANQGLGGVDCVIFYGIYNIGPGTATGDDPGEWGSLTCPYTFSPAEPSPQRPAGAGLSGYTTTWRLAIPILEGGNTMPSQIPLYLAFDHISTTAYIMRRANGEPLPMMELTTP